MTIVVTGASGFIGRWLCQALAGEGRPVLAFVRSAGTAPVGERITERVVDIGDARDVHTAIADAAPDLIVHLAAQSFPGRSWTAPHQTMRSNVEGTLNLLEAVRPLGSACRLLVCGSSAQYAPTDDSAPVREDAPQQPLSPYAVSKIAADQLSELYARAYGLDILRFRPFAVIGPGKTGDAPSDFARRIVAIERGGDPRMIVGDLSPVRDFVHVRDAAAAILTLGRHGETGAVYNIASGQGTSIAGLLESLRTLSSTPFDIVTDPALIRPVDDPVKIGDPSALKALGWSPATRFDETLEEILGYWREWQGR